MDLQIKEENSTAETTKCGEILRNLCGQYTFLCFHCGNVYKFAEHLLKHIETHFIRHEPKEPSNFIESLEIEPIPVLKNENHFEIDPIEVETFYDIDFDCKVESLDIVESALNDWKQDEDPTNSLKGDSKYKCHICKKTFNLLSKLVYHKKLHNVDEANNIFSCPICKMIKGSKEELEKHEAIHDPNNPLNCTICNRFFKKPIDFMNHVQIHENLREYQCSYCELRFNISRYKVQHERRCRKIGNFEKNKNVSTPTSTPITKIQVDVKTPVKTPITTTTTAKFKSKINPLQIENICHKCERTFETPYLLDYHKRLHNLIKDGNSFKCPICKISKNTKEDLEKHGIAHNSADPMVCGICHKLCRRPCELLDHIQVHENLQEYECGYCKQGYNTARYRHGHEKRCPKNQNAAIDPNAEILICDLCGKTFQAKSQIAAHLRKHLQLYRCDLCGSGFSLKENLARHLERGHENQLKIQSSTDQPIYANVQGKIRKCHICNKICDRKSVYEAHMIRHANLRLHKCTICDARFNLPRNLRLHMFIHSTDKPYKCEICGLKIRQKCNYTRHLLIHERNENTKKPFECHLCDKTYFLNNSLKVHIRSHTGERPYQCSECGLTFVNQSKLTHHTKKTHSTAKPHKCDICDRCFTMRYQLTSHIKSQHTHPMNHVCDVCGKRFDLRKNLRQHELLHRPEKKQQCRYCDMKFAQRSALKGHEKSRHLVV